MPDITRDLRATVVDAAARKAPLRLAGAGSKTGFFGRDIDAVALDVTGHSGILDYQPDELVITARAGTPISAINAALAEQEQMLPAECPLFGGAATLGGSVACNASGPGRPWRGSLRDSILGLQFINGKGELLRYGGQVMKNVAGYDVSRLHAGAQGTLGLITEVTLRVVPRAAAEITLAYRCDAPAAIEHMLSLAALPGPLSGACWLADTLYIRVSGSEAGVARFRKCQGGDLVTQQAPWQALDSLDLAPFCDDQPLWRLSVAPGCSLPAPLPDVIDWGGAQRFFAGEHQRTVLRNVADSVGGRVQLWRGGDRRGEVNGPLSKAEQLLQQRLKDALDPHRIFNCGRVFSWL